MLYNAFKDIGDPRLPRWELVPRNCLLHQLMAIGSRVPHCRLVCPKTLCRMDFHPEWTMLGYLAMVHLQLEAQRTHFGRAVTVTVSCQECIWYVSCRRDIRMACKDCRWKRQCSGSSHHVQKGIHEAQLVHGLVSEDLGCQNGVRDDYRLLACILSSPPEVSTCMRS